MESHAATCEWKYPMNPSPSRGMPMHLSRSSKGDRFSYPSQENAVLRQVGNLLTGHISFERHSKKVTAVQCSTVVDTVVSGDDTGFINVWHADHPTQLVSWDLQGIIGPVHDITFNDEGDKCTFVGDATTGTSGRAVNLKMKKTDLEIKGHSLRALTCAYKPNRPYKLYTGSEDTTINSYVVSGYSLNKQIKTHKGFVNCARASADGKHLVTVSVDKTIVIHNIETDEPVKTIENAHDGTIYSLSWFPDGSKFATCSADKTVKVWSAEGELLSTLHVAEKPTVDDMQMGVVKVNDFLVSVSLSGAINLWKDETLSYGKVEKPDQIILGHNVCSDYS